VSGTIHRIGVGHYGLQTATGTIFYRDNPNAGRPDVFDQGVDLVDTAGEWWTIAHGRLSGSRFDSAVSVGRVLPYLVAVQRLCDAKTEDTFFQEMNAIQTNNLWSQAYDSFDAFVKSLAKIDEIQAFVGQYQTKHVVEVQKGLSAAQQMFVDSRPIQVNDMYRIGLATDPKQVAGGVPVARMRDAVGGFPDRLNAKKDGRDRSELPPVTHPSLIIMIGIIVALALLLSLQNKNEKKSKEE